MIDDELRLAVAELRAWAAHAGTPLTHLDDAQVLDGIARCMTRLPDATLQLVRDRGLERVAAVLARFGSITTATSQ